MNSILEIHPLVWSMLTASRTKAMREGAQGIATDLLGHAEEQRGDLHAAWHLRMAAAEILFLDNRLEESLRAFDVIGTVLQDLPEGLRRTTRTNRRWVEFHSRSRSAHQAEFSLHGAGRAKDATDPVVLLEALQAARDGKHRQAYLGLRQFLVQCYRTARWHEIRIAFNELCIECRALGHYESAAAYSLLACDVESARKTAAAILSDGNTTPERFAKLIGKLCASGALLQHGLVVSTFIRDGGDLLPDGAIDVAAEYLLRWVEIERTGLRQLDGGTPAWEALKGLGPRLSVERAKEVAEAAVRSSAWTSAESPRRELLITVIGAVAGTLDEHTAANMVTALIPLATERRGFDYEDALAALYELSKRSDEAHEAVASILPKEPQHAPASLSQLARLLGKSPASPEPLNAFVDRLVARVDGQVIQMSSDSPAPQGDGFGALTFVDGEKQVVVQMSNFGPAFEAVLSFPELITTERVDALAKIMVERSLTPANIITNREELLLYLARLAPFLGEETLRESLVALMPIARGEFAEVLSEEISQPDNPLAAFRRSMGHPSDFQAAAIRFVAACAQRLCAPEIEQVVAAGLGATDTRVRAGAFKASADLSSLSSAVIPGLLMGTRDQDSLAAGAAMLVLAQRADQLQDSEISLLVQVLLNSSENADARLRAVAGRAALALSRHSLREGHRERVGAILERLRADRFWSVRQRVRAAEDN